MTQDYGPPVASIHSRIDKRRFNGPTYICSITTFYGTDTTGETRRRSREAAERDKMGLEVGTLKQKLALYADCDEIKMELEIIKVGSYTPAVYAYQR